MLLFSLRPVSLRLKKLQRRPTSLNSNETSRLETRTTKRVCRCFEGIRRRKHRLNGSNPPSSLEKGGIPYPPNGDVLQSPEVAPLSTITIPSILQREFKISGQILEPGQYDKLTYVSLIHQIESGLAKGYSEKDIADAVIKSISPHSSLRNYVLTSPDRSLTKLRSILRVFFQEKTVVGFYQALSRISPRRKKVVAENFPLSDWAVEIVAAENVEERKVESSSTFRCSKFGR